jgi:hypothetical protein
MAPNRKPDPQTEWSCHSTAGTHTPETTFKLATEMTMNGGLMMELNDKIARLEMLIEQNVIHLRSFKGRGPDALKRDVLDMLHQLRWYKEDRARLEERCGTVEMAA